MEEAIDKHSSDSRFNGCGVSWRRNLDLWNLYSSEFDEMERRGDFDIGSELGLKLRLGVMTGIMVNSDAGRSSVVPFMPSLLLVVRSTTEQILLFGRRCSTLTCTALEQLRLC